MRSAGLLPFRLFGQLEVLIAHPGGPFFAGRDNGAWSIVKGLVKPGEEDESAATREFNEETGWMVRSSAWTSLGETRMKSGKIVVAWAVAEDFDLDTFNPGTFTMHGREYPEVDEVRWVSATQARIALNTAQQVFIDRLEIHLDLNLQLRRSDG